MVEAPHGCRLDMPPREGHWVVGGCGSDEGQSPFLAGRGAFALWAARLCLI